MSPQVASLSAKGLATSYIAGEQKDEGVKRAVMKGEYQLVLFTPEMLLESKLWRKMLLGEVYSQRLRVLVVDEAHTVKKWYARCMQSFLLSCEGVVMPDHT